MPLALSRRFPTPSETVGRTQPSAYMASCVMVCRSCSKLRDNLQIFENPRYGLIVSWWYATALRGHALHGKDGQAMLHTSEHTASLRRTRASSHQLQAKRAPQKSSCENESESATKTVTSQESCGIHTSMDTGELGRQQH
jgi:hypothetical protein